MLARVMPGCRHAPFQHVLTLPQAQGEKGRGRSQVLPGKVGRTDRYHPRGVPVGGRMAGITHPSPWLLSASGLNRYHVTEERKGCRVHWSAPGFEGTRVTDFGKSVVFLSPGAPTAALRHLSTGGALRAAPSRAAPGSLPPPEVTQPK